MSENRSADMIVAFGIGMVAGAVTALLLAPASGEETRKRIADFTRESAAKAKDGVGTAAKFVKGQKDRIIHAVEEGRRVYEGESPTAQ